MSRPERSPEETALISERDKYRESETFRAKTARTFEEAGMVDPASKQWGYAADNATIIYQLAASHPTYALDPLMPIFTGGARAELARAFGRASYYRARSLSLLQGPPPVIGPQTVLHPFPLPSAPAAGSPEANATPSTPDAAAQADEDQKSPWLYVAGAALVLLAWKILFRG